MLLSFYDFSFLLDSLYLLLGARYHVIKILFVVFIRTPLLCLHMNVDFPLDSERINNQRATNKITIIIVSPPSSGERSLHMPHYRHFVDYDDEFFAL